MSKQSSGLQNRFKDNNIKSVASGIYLYQQHSNIIALDCRFSKKGNRPIVTKPSKSIYELACHSKKIRLCCNPYQKSHNPLPCFIFKIIFKKPTICYNSGLDLLHFHSPSGRGRTTLPYGAHNALGRLKDAGGAGAAGGAFQQFVAVVHCDLRPLPVESERNVKGGSSFDGSSCS